MTQNVVNDIKQAIILNSDANMQMDLHNFVPTGSPVEVGLLKFCADQGVSLHERF